MSSRRVGDGVTLVAPGDHVITLFAPECGKCVHCLSDRTNRCVAIRDQQGLGYLPDGTTRLSRDGEPLRHFMGTSTFAEYTVMPEIALAKVSPEAPLDGCAPFACGLSTGIGAALYTAKVEPGSTCVVFGCGLVGLGAVIGCRLAGAERIVAVDLSEERLAQARHHGATETRVAGDDTVDWIRAETGGFGADYTFEATGIVSVMRQAVESAREAWGLATMCGVAGKGETLEIVPRFLITGRRVTGSSFGGVKGRTQVPLLVDRWLAGEIDVESLLSHRITLDEVNHGFELMEAPGRHPQRDHVRLSGALQSEAARAHRTPVSDRDGVEGEMELVREVERHPLRPLRLDDDPVLFEDDVLELLQHRVGLLQVVVAADHEEARRPLGPVGTAGEEVDHPGLTSPAEPQDDRVGEVQLVAAATLGRDDDLVPEHGEVLVRRCLRPHDLVAQDVTVGLDGVPRHDRPLGVAEQPGVDEGEVAEVGEVLDLARSVARPRVGPAEHGRPGDVLELGHLRQRPAGLLQRNPDEAVALGAAERGCLRLGRSTRRIGELGDPGASAVRAVAPAVVGTDDLVALDGAERERGAAVDAEVEECVRNPGAVAPEDERLAEEVDGDGGTGREIVRVPNGVPAAAQGRSVAGYRRSGHRSSLWRDEAGAHCRRR